MAQELLTPLTVASGFLQVIPSANVRGEAFEEALETVTRNLQEIISLVNNIYFLQEMDMIEPSLKPTDVGEVVTSSIEKRRSNAERNGVSMELRIAKDVPAIPAEPKSLFCAIGAILDNAIKGSINARDVQIEVV